MFKSQLSKRVVLCLTLALMFCFASTAMAAKTEIVWTMRANNQERITMWESWAKEYEAKNPNIDIILQPITGAYLTPIKTWMATDVPCDVMWMGLAFWELADVLLPIDDLYNSLPDKNDFIQAAIASNMWDGKLLAMPFGINTHAVMYNKDMLNAAGLKAPADSWTYDDAISMGKRLTKDTDGDGVPNQYGLNFYFPNFLWGYGGNIFSKDGKTVLIDREPTYEALDTWSGLLSGNSGAQAPQGTFAGNAIAEMLKSQIAIGNRGFFDIATYNQQAKFDWDIVGMPALQSGGKKYRISFQSPESWAISKFTKVPNEAKAFVKFLMEREHMVEFCKMGTVIPVQRAILSRSFTNIAPGKNVMAFAQAIDYAGQQYFAHPAQAKLGMLTSHSLLTSLWKGEVSSRQVVPEIARLANEALTEFYTAK